MITKLVISGGGPTLFRSLGVLQHLMKQDYFKMSDINSIYGTSAGAIIAVILCLGFDWDTINDYVIERPWQDAYPIDIKCIFDAYTKRGIFDRKILEIFFKPLFDAKDISMDVTLEEFYKYCNKDVHMYSFEIHGFCVEDISHKSHPDLALLTALQMSSAIPILISPVYIQGKCYVDGGVICNYPLDHCLGHCLDSSGNQATSISEILGIQNQYESISEKYNVNENSTILDFILCFLYKFIFNRSENIFKQQLDNEVVCKSEFMTLAYLQNVLSSKETRREILENGIEIAKEFLLNKSKSTT